MPASNRLKNLNKTLTFQLPVYICRKLGTISLLAMSHLQYKALCLWHFIFLFINIQNAESQTNTPGHYYLSDTFCTNQTILVGNMLFDASSPTGTVVLPGAAQSGQDSFIHVSFYFFQPSVNELQQILCEGDTLWVNQTAYHAGFYIGEEILSSGSANGCDSLIFIDLQIEQPRIVQIKDTLVHPEFRLYNGVKYDFRKLSGIEVLEAGASNGCDSILDIQLSIIFPDTMANVYFPNAFKPEGQDANNRFYISADKTIATIQKLIIVDRWGELLFQVENAPPNDPDWGWDGSFRGKPAPPGVYLVQATFAQKNGSMLEKSGSLCLIR
jgi:gliding motility-associated-like protein